MSKTSPQATHAGSPPATPSRPDHRHSSVDAGVSARLVFRYYLCMLGIVAIDGCFALIYAVPLVRFLPTALAMSALMLVGAWFIFRPIKRFVDNPHHTRFPIRSIATLSLVCTAYAALVVGGLALAKILLLPSLLGFDIDALLTTNEQLWLPIIHTLYYTVLVYFVMVDFEGSLRARFYEWYGELIPATRGKIVYRLLAAFAVTSLLPAGLVVLHALEHDVVNARTGLFKDLIAAALALVVCLVFVTRSLLRPIRALEVGMTRVRHDDLAVNVPVLSNDETGRLADGFNRMVKGLRERALIRQTFGRYVPQRVAAAILSNSGRLEPRSAVATIVYADLVGFTEIVEHSSAEQVVNLLNEFFSASVEIIESNHGVVTQFQGDAMLITFNLPVADEQHADSALRAALAIRDLCRSTRFAGIELRTRIGIATGHVTAGNVGSDTRMSYTVHGDAVNLSARLEQMNKQHDTDLLIDEETVGRLRAQHSLTFVGEMQVRGRARSVRVYGLGDTDLANRSTGD